MKDSVFKFTTPVLIICFNRPQYVEQQIAALREIKPPIVFLSSDGARKNVADDKEKVNEVRQKYLDGIDWDCELKTRFLDNNIGCSQGPITAMQWFFSQVQEGIILEDDIIPGKDFFRFAQEMLNKYRHTKKIISVSGCNLGYKGKANEYFYCKIMNMWGWATWKDRFLDVDWDIKSWGGKKNKLYYLYSRLRNSIIDLDINWWKHWRFVFNKTNKVKFISWWDYQFIYHQLKKRQYSIYPGRNLITNIGFEGDATHTKKANERLNELIIDSIEFPLREVEKIKNNVNYYENYLKPVWANYYRPNFKFYIGKLFSLKS